MALENLCLMACYLASYAPGFCGKPVEDFINDFLFHLTPAKEFPALKSSANNNKAASKKGSFVPSEPKPFLDAIQQQIREEEEMEKSIPLDSLTISTWKLDDRDNDSKELTVQVDKLIKAVDPNITGIPFMLPLNDPLVGIDYTYVDWIVCRIIRCKNDSQIDGQTRRLGDSNDFLESPLAQLITFESKETKISQHEANLIMKKVKKLSKLHLVVCNAISTFQVQSSKQPKVTKTPTNPEAKSQTSEYDGSNHIVRCIKVLRGESERKRKWAFQDLYPNRADPPNPLGLVLFISLEQLEK